MQYIYQNHPPHPDERAAASWIGFARRGGLDLNAAGVADVPTLVAYDKRCSALGWWYIDTDAPTAALVSEVTEYPVEQDGTDSWVIRA